MDLQNKKRNEIVLKKQIDIQDYWMCYEGTCHFKRTGYQPVGQEAGWDILRRPVLEAIMPFAQITEPDSNFASFAYLVVSAAGMYAKAIICHGMNHRPIIKQVGLFL